MVVQKNIDLSATFGNARRSDGLFHNSEREVKKLRRVIAGIDDKGVSRFVSDEIIEAVTPPTWGTDIVHIFGTDEALTVPFDGTPPQNLAFFPKQPAAFRFIIFTYPSKSDRGEPRVDEAAIKEAERLVPGANDVVSESGGQHATSTVDLEYVISGALTLTLDSGEKRVLRAGDCLVQCGTMHSWENETDEPATMLLVFIGANQDTTRFQQI